MVNSRQPTILNIITILISLALIAFSVASVYFTANGTKQMDQLLQPGKYIYNTGYPSYVLQDVTFKYNTTPDALSYTACAISCAIALISIIGAVLAQKKHNSSPKLILYTLALPSFKALVINLAALIYTFTAFQTDDFGACDFHDDIYRKIEKADPITVTCSRENAAGFGVVYKFEGLVDWKKDNLGKSAYYEIKKGRQLLAPLFVANLLVGVVVGMKWWDGRKKV